MKVLTVSLLIEIMLLDTKGLRIVKGLKKSYLSPCLNAEWFAKSEYKFGDDGHSCMNEEQMSVFDTKLRERFEEIKNADFIFLEESIAFVNVAFAASLAEVSEDDIRRAVKRSEIRKRVIKDKAHIRVDDLEEWYVRKNNGMRV